MNKEQAIKMLRHCEAESHCYDGIHGTCKGCNKRIALDMAIEALQGMKMMPRKEVIEVLEYMLEYMFHKDLHTAKKEKEALCTAIQLIKESKGEWVKTSEPELYCYTCSICGELNEYEDNFCPNCGADMRGEDE